MQKIIRVVIARLGMDAHWRGSIVVARALRDAGMEVIYIGNQMPKNIVKTAVEEDADVIGLSTLSGNYMILLPEIMKLLKEEGLGDKKVILGGTVPPDDVPIIKEMGVSEVFGPGSSLKKIVSFVSDLAMVQ